MTLNLRLSPFGQAHVATMLAIALPVAVLIGCAAGALYQAALLWLPTVVALPTLLLAALGGAAIAIVGVRVRCRSRLLMGLLGVIAGLAADASSWAVAFHKVRDRDLVWVESDLDASMRRIVPSERTRDFILGRYDIRTEEGRRALEELANEPPPPERLTETVHVRTLADYMGFRWRWGWPERGSERSGFTVVAAWGGELALFVGLMAWLATCIVRARYVCAAHRQPLSCTLDATVPGVDHVALSAAAAREDLDGIIAVPLSPEGRRVRFELHRCPSCDFAIVSACLQWRSAGLARTKVLVANASIDPACVDALLARLAPPGHGERPERGLPSLP